MTTGDFTPSVLHRQDIEIACCAMPRPYRLGSVKMHIDDYNLIGNNKEMEEAKHNENMM